MFACKVGVADHSRSPWKQESHMHCVHFIKVHHLDEVFIATAVFVSILRLSFVWTHDFFLYLNISVPLQHYLLSRCHRGYIEWL